MKHLSGFNNLTGLAFLLQSVSTETFLRGLLLANIIGLIMWKFARRQLDGERAAGCLVVVVRMGKSAAQRTPWGEMLTFLAGGVCALVCRDCGPIVGDSSLLSRMHGRWLTFALAFWRRNLLPTT